MAIVDMKKLTVMAVSADKGKVLRALQKLRCAQIIPPADEGVRARVHSDLRQAEKLDESMSRIAWAIKDLGRYAGKSGGMLASFAPKPEVDTAKAQEVLAQKDALLEVVYEAERCERRMGELRTRDARIQAAREQFLPWAGLDVPLERIGATRATETWLATLPAKQWEALTAAIAEQGLAAEIAVVSQDRTSAYVLAVCHRSVRTELEALLRTHEAAQVTFGEARGTVAEKLDALDAEKAELLADQQAIEAQRSALAAHVDGLKALHDLFDAERSRVRAAEHFATTAQTFLLQAWVPAERVADVEARLRETSPSCALQSEDPTDDEKPPTALRNRRLAEPFEAVISNFSMPDPRGVDPTFIMAPFFACFFGMMVSDAGYGLIMAILIPLALHFLKPQGGMRKMMWVIGIGAVATVFWGAMFDTWFGASVKPMLINPMTQPLEMMGLCLGIGAVHLFVGAGIGMYKNIKRGDWLAGLVDQGCWMILVAGVGMLLLPATAKIGQWMALVGMLGVLLFTKRGEKNPLKRVLGGLGSLYGITSWLSDLLSYARLFGMGLATGVIGMVINMLAMMAIGSRFNLIRWLIGGLILVGGHVFNLAINALGAYVHACRLQYIEFFSKFYEDGGDPFRPLDDQTRYVRLNEQEM